MTERSHLEAVGPRDPGRDADPQLAAALAAVAVPDHHPDFWAALDARLDRVDEATAWRRAFETGERPTLRVLDASDADGEPDPRLSTGELPAVGELRQFTAGMSPTTGYRIVAVAAAVVLLALATGAVLSTARTPSTVPAANGPGAAFAPAPPGVSELAERTAPPATPAADTGPDGTVALPDVPAATAVPEPLFVDGATQAVQDWFDLLAAGDGATAADLLGPATSAYLRLLGVDPATYFTEGYGTWAAAAADYRTLAVDESTAVVVVEGLVAAEGASEHRVVAIPVVRHDEGWRVEPAAFGLDGDGRLVIGPKPYTSTRIVPVEPETGAVSFSVGTGPAVLSIYVDTELVESVTLLDDAASSYVWDVPEELSTGEHLLIAVLAGDGVLAAQAGILATVAS